MPSPSPAALLLLAAVAGAVDVPSTLVARSPSRYVRNVYDVGEGEAVAMTCTFSNTEASLGYFSLGGQSEFTGRLILWYRVDSHGGEELVSIGRTVDEKMGAFHDYKILMADSYTSVLFIRSAAANHAGFYKCALSDGGPLHQIFYLNLTKSRLVIRHPLASTRHVVSGTSVRLHCNVSFTYPRPLVYWTRGRGRTRGTIRPVAWGPVLTLRHMVKALAGTYTCHADDFITPPVSTGFVLRVAETNLKSGPRFLTAQYNHAPPGFSNAKPRYGHLYTLTCRSSGYPRVFFHWFKNGKNIAELKDPNLSVHASSAHNGDSVSELQVRKFKLKDRGIYRCKAFNIYGSRYHTFRLDQIRNMPAKLRTMAHQKIPRVSPPIDDEDYKRRRNPFEEMSGSGEKKEPPKAVGSGDLGSGGLLPPLSTVSNVTRVPNFTARPVRIVRKRLP